MRKIWPFTFNMLSFAGFACVVPFLVLYYQSIGLTGTEIGLLTGIAPLVTLFSGPLWTNLADKTGRHRLIMSAAILGGAFAMSLFPVFSAFAPIFVIAILLNTFVAPIGSFADSATMYMLGDHKELYGRIRLGGTIGFGVAAAIAGTLVQNYGLKLIFWICAPLFLLAWLVSQKLVYNPFKAGEAGKKDIRTLLASPRWVLFLVVAFAGGLSFAATNNYLFPYMKELGADESTMGLALTLGTVAEIPVMFFGNRLIRLFKPYGLLILAMVLTGSRLMLFGVAEAPSFVLVLQLVSGLTFPAMWIAGVAYADHNAPAGLSATAQGLFSAMNFGFGSAVGGFIGGLLLEQTGGRSLFLVFGAAVLIIVALAALLQKRLPVKPVEQAPRAKTTQTVQTVLP